MSSLIEVKHLKKYYNKGEIKALDDVSVNIERGDVMVVIGPSGSGKSTLLRSLNLLEVPTAGEIDFDGVDITKKKVKNEAGKWVKLDLDKHRQKMGMVFQHFNLFPNMTVKKNITLAPVQTGRMKQEEADKLAMELLERIWKPPAPIRMLTVTGQNLVSPEEENEQLMLFDEAGRARRQRREQLEQTVDAIRQKYGRGAIHSAGLMDNDLGIALKDADEEEEEL